MATCGQLHRHVIIVRDYDTHGISHGSRTTCASVRLATDVRRRASGWSCEIRWQRSRPAGTIYAGTTYASYVRLWRTCASAHRICAIPARELG